MLLCTPHAIMWSASSPPPTNCLFLFLHPYNYLSTHPSFSLNLSLFQSFSVSLSLPAAFEHHLSFSCLFHVSYCMFLLFLLYEKPTLVILSPDACCFWLSNAQHRFQWLQEKNPCNPFTALHNACVLWGQHQDLSVENNSNEVGQQWRPLEINWNELLHWWGRE